MILEACLGVLTLWIICGWLQKPSKKCGMYVQPGITYPLKMIWARLMVRYRKKRTVKFTDASVGYGTAYGSVLYDLERPQHLVSDKDAIDSAYFCGNGKDGTWVVLRIGRRHSRIAEVWLTLNMPGIGLLQNALHPDAAVCNTSQNSFSAAGLKISCSEPGRTWRITYNGLLRKDLATELEEGRGFETVHVKFSFLWNAVTRVFDFNTDMDDSLLAGAIACEPWSMQYLRSLQQDNHNHYEQGGELRGIIAVDGCQEQTLILKSLRSHKFGVRNWTVFHRYVAHFGWLEDGTFFNLSSYCLPGTLSNLQCGWVSYPNSEMQAVSSTDLDLSSLGENGDPPHEYTIRFKAGVRSYTLKVVRGVTPCYYHGDNRTNVVMESACTFEGSGAKGRGFAEFCYRRQGEENSKQAQSSVQSVQQICPQIDDLSQTHLAVIFTDPLCTSSQLVGGKGSQLSQLTQLQLSGCTIPKGFCLGIDAFDLHLSKYPDILEKVKTLIDVSCGNIDGDLRETCKDVTSSILNADMCDEVQHVIERYMCLTFGEAWLHARMKYAVRSSAAGEDSEELSAAGQMDTVLGVTGLQHIFTAVLKSWASYFALPATQYRRQHGQPIYQARCGKPTDASVVNVGMGVVIQEMVSADAAGVLFTRDPVSGNPGVMSINANYGLGESVVSGSAEPDYITVSRTWNDELAVKDKLIGSKRTILVLDEGSSEGGTVEKEPDTEQMNKCSITDDVILKLARIGIQLEKHYADARDIEWAVQGQHIYILQGRPITTLDSMSEWELLHEFDSPLASEKSELLTTGNIGEMMPGAMTPLTISTFMRAVDHGILDIYVNSWCVTKSCSAKYLHKLMGVYCNHGFLNMNMCMAINQLTSSMGNHKMAQLSLIGEVREEMDLHLLDVYHGTFPMWRRLLNFIKGFMHLRASTNKTKRWDEMLQTFVVGEHCTSAVDLYNEIDRQLFSNYYQNFADSVGQSAMSSMWSQFLIGILSQGRAEWKTEHYSDMAMLLSKCEDVCSANVPLALQKLAQVIIETGKAKEFTNKSREDAVKWLESTECGSAGKQYGEFMKRHGHRCIREAEMREKSWQSEPTKLITAVQSLVEASGKKFSTSHRVVDIEEAISKLQSPVTNGAKFALRRIIPKARQSVGGREWGKSVSVKMVEAFKQAYWRLAQLLCQEGRLPDPDLLMFFTHPEIAHLLTTRSGSLIAKAHRRRKVLDKQMATVFHRINFGHPVPIENDREEEHLITSSSVKGFPVSQGIVQGTARVVTSLQDAALIQPGDILIVHFTDVGWTPYFPLIGGLVTEIGGLVSHGAVVAREYGLPCVVNCHNATRIFKSGDRVILNGSLGIIEKVEKSDDSQAV